MNKKIIIAAALILAFAIYAAAQGVIIPEPRDRNLPPAPIVKSQAIDVRIEGSVAITTIDQVFLNRWNRPMEGTFIFPVPKSATVSEFYLWIDGKKVKGELLDKDTAARIYRDIVRKMKDPALLEWNKFNLFKASVFPIPANGERRIELKYTEALQSSSGLVRYTYPLKGRGKTYEEPISTFSLAVSIKSDIPITSVYSPTHTVDVSMENDRNVSAGMEEKSFQPASDFQLYISLSNKDFGLSFTTFTEAGVDEGYFMMLIAPRAGLEQKTSSKDIVFVLDTSGSMLDDDKIGQALSALKFGIKSLNEDDRFGLITFSTEVRPFRDSLIPASKTNVNAALASLDNVSAVGATNIHDALRTYIEMFKYIERPRYLVFLTDGLPTHVERDPNVIIRKTKEWCPEGVRLFNWGVGFDVDTRLLDTISADHGGVSEYVKPKEEMELKLGQFFEKISHPVLTDLKLEVEGISIKDLYPKNLPDLFKGSQLVLFGRQSGKTSGTAILTGSVNGKTQRFTYPIESNPIENGDFIAHLWATRKVGYLLEEIRLHGENKELKDEVVRLAKKYGLVTPYTSYLVLEPGMDSDQFPDTRTDDVRRQQPVTVMPAEKRDEAAAAPRQTTGESAVRYSKKLRELKEEESFADAEKGTVRRIAGKTFNFTDGTWIDSEFEDGMKSITIVFNSDEYFDLLGKHTDMAKWLSLGENLIVVFDHVAYRIIPESQ